MARSRRDEIRQRIAKRRKEKERLGNGLKAKKEPSIYFDELKQEPISKRGPIKVPIAKQEAKQEMAKKPIFIKEPNPEQHANEQEKLNLEQKPSPEQNTNEEQYSKQEPILKQEPKRKQDLKMKKNSVMKSESLLPLPDDEEKYGFNQIISYEGGGDDETVHPLFRKNIFLFKILASVCLFLAVAVMFHSHYAALDPAKNLVKKAMNTEFQFAAVTNWYENKFGKPLALLPISDKKSNQYSSNQYAVPASGRILENFQKNGQGIMIETSKGTKVEAMNGGVVTFAGVKEGTGKTVIIQHADKTESWYGNLDSINVNLYENIKKGNVVGTVSSAGGKNTTKGEFYFAIKKGDHFIDPIQVIRFE